MAWVGAFSFSNQCAGFTGVMVDVNAMVCIVHVRRCTPMCMQMRVPTRVCVCVCVCVCEDG